MRGLLLLIITTTVAVTWIARRSRAQSTRTVPIRHRLERAAGIVLSCLGFHVPTSYRHLQFEVLRGVCALIDVSVTGAVRVPHAVVVSLHPDDHVRLGGGNLTVFCQDVVDHIGVVADTRGWGHQPDLQIAVEPTDHAPLGSPQVSRCP